MLRNRRTLKFISFFFIVLIINEIIFPPAIFALTSGPSSPEFSSFEPVTTTDMVDLFSGDFVYNLPVISIPGPEGAGYSLSLSYHSGVTPEEEASWVGYGWTLNPGAINRYKIGYPDDFKNVKVKSYNKSRPNWSVSTRGDLSLEIMSFRKYQKDESKQSNDSSFKFSPSLSLNKSVRFNNYAGFSKTFGLGLGVKGIGSVSMTKAKGGYSLGINPSINILKMVLPKKELIEKMEKIKKFFGEHSLKKEITYNAKNKEGEVKQGTVTLAANIDLSLKYNLNSFAWNEIPVNIPPYRGISFNSSLGGQVNPWGPIGIEFGYTGNFNIQMNKPYVENNAYGYMYSSDRTSDEDLYDYSVEKAAPFNARDKYLGIPHAAVDNFSVSGENVGGGFRLFHNKMGEFAPNYTESEQTAIQTGLDVGIGGTLQVGFTFGMGGELTRIEKWGTNNDYRFSAYNQGFFRFNNDMGGEIRYTSSNDPNDSPISMSNLINFKADMGDLKSLSSENSGRSSFIDYKTDTKGHLSTFEILNSNGQYYKYGLPVYSRNEINLSTTIDPKVNKIESNFIAYKPLYVTDNKIFDNDVVVGEKIDEQYATSYLLTEITGSNYVDVNANNQLDSTDIGAWTKFLYRKWNSDESTPNEWYQFRAPYNGLSFTENQLSDIRDNQGTVSLGEKEMYYLKAIETKTHIAFFVTNRTKAEDYVDITGNPLAILNGSGEIRKDCMGARRVESDKDVAAESSANTDTKQYSERLEKIVLFSKKRFEKPLQVVNFKYTYSLCRGVYNGLDGAGKLTLKSVWFEYEGVVKTRVTPYLFKYSYPTDYPTIIANKYPDISKVTGYFSEDEQNPFYEPSSTDIWGNFQYNGKKKNAERRPWVYQGKLLDDAFDPAAWNLKQIILPSGGEIHVQYEQKDYQYVQDQKALAMVSLLDGSSDGYSPESTKYYINTEDLGIPQDKVSDYYMQIKDYFIAKDGEPPRYAYFKYLYALLGDRPASLENCWSDFIDGFTSVNEVGFENGKIYLRLGDARRWFKWFGNKFKNPVRNNVPRTVCYDYVEAKADGFLNSNNCDCEFSKFEEIERKVNSYSTSIAKDVISGNKSFTEAFKDKNWRSEVSRPALWHNVGHIFDKVLDRYAACKHVDYTHSYLRVPVYNLKKGGGVRVKRLLMYDKGIDNGEEVLFGSTYQYKLDDGTSSGVATNEPDREENALVTLLDSKELSWLGNAIYGDDVSEWLGPLGDPLLPAPAVGYSRVVVQNIHTGKTGTGYNVHEFNTVKDYPLKYKNTELSGNNKKREWIKLPMPSLSFGMDRQWLSQGYAFIIKNFHGTPRKVSMYAGDIEKGKVNPPVAFTEYNYFDLEKESVPMLSFDKATGEFSIMERKPGQEEDITIETRSTYNRNIDFSLDLDISITLCFPPPITVSMSPSFTYDEKKLCTHVNAKVIRYPSIVKSITTFADNVVSKTENLAFNPQTGQPVLSRVTDEFDQLYLKNDGLTGIHDGGYYSYSIPASWIYEQLGPKSSNVDFENRLGEVAAQIVTYGKSGRIAYDNKTLQSVISASVTEYAKDWFTEDNSKILTEYGIENIDAIAKLNNKWMPKSSYIFKTDEVTNIKEDNATAYNSGILKEFEMFKWNADNDSRWLKSNEILKYSPNWNAIEEKDVTGIYSSAIYGYFKQLPVIVAQNADYNSIVFNDFETDFSSVITNKTGHSGKRSVNLNAEPGYTFISPDYKVITLNDHLISKGGLIRFWVKSIHPDIYDFENASPDIKVNINNNLKANCTKVAQTGEWSLYEAKISNWGNSIMKDQTIEAKIEYKFQAGEMVYIDDFRFQPMDAATTCYTYDPTTFQLQAQFDDQHFGTFFQYNDEGQLVRKIIETERGMKTLQERQYNINSVRRSFIDSLLRLNN